MLLYGNLYWPSSFALFLASFYIRAGGTVKEGGGFLPPPILAYQLTILQPGGSRLCPPHYYPCQKNLRPSAGSVHIAASVETMDSLCCWTFRVNGLCSHTNGRRWPAGGGMQFVAFSQHQLAWPISMAVGGRSEAAWGRSTSDRCCSSTHTPHTYCNNFLALSCSLYTTTSTASPTSPAGLWGRRADWMASAATGAAATTNLVSVCLRIITR